jgi:CheY-like chemotaxis protein
MTDSDGRRNVVLIVDDDVEIITQVRHHLDHDWEVLYATDREAALGVLSSSRVDAVVLDRNFDEGSEGQVVFGSYLGDKLLQLISARWPYICVVMFTAFRGTHPTSRSIRYGAFHVLEKHEPHRLPTTCALGVVWQRVRRIREMSIARIAFGETLNCLQKDVLPLLYEMSIFSNRDAIADRRPFVVDVITCLPCSLGRHHLSGGQVEVVPVPRAIREQLSPVAIEVFSGDGRPECKAGQLLPSIRSRLVAAIYDRHKPLDLPFDADNVQQRIVGYVWFESECEYAFDEFHCDVAMGLADLLSEALIREREYVMNGTVHRRDERDEVLFQVANGICDSLQVSQSLLDGAVRRLSFEDSSEDSLTQLKSGIDAARDGLDESVTILNHLYREVAERITEIEHVDITSVVQSALTNSTSLGSSSACEIKFEHPDNLMTVAVDPNELEAGLTVLFAQSIEAAVVSNRCSSPKVEVTLREAGEAVVLRVSDNGETIEADQLPWVFQRMFMRPCGDSRRRPPRRPSGLGRLQHHIKEIGGNSIALIDDNQCVCFEFVLPRVATPAGLAAKELSRW